ncbi:MAG: VWA domain-containing protein [Clostridia bacterium]|nr:VWA domain-containing protein [Clostridia bacterium]
MRLRVLQRTFSALLCVALFAALLPLTAKAAKASVSTSVADPETLSSWETLFPANSSRYSGSVFLDKSVYTASDALSDEYFKDVRGKLSFGKDNFGNDNFMVALSALGSNSEVLGYNSIPTDTIFMLDASTSMGTGDVDTSSLDDMVDGANDAIKRLLSLNNHNRVGVVIYNAETTVLLPLDRYTVGNNDGNLLRFERVTTGGSGTDADPYTYQNRIYIASNVKDGDGNAVPADYKAQILGTYTQGGINDATKQFLAAEPVIPDGKIQGGTTRMPILVLMTDGAPSLHTKGQTDGTLYTINSYDKATNSNGDWDRFYESDVATFSTILTAAWAKAEIEEHYGTDLCFYTLGYALTEEHAYGQNVLNPMNPENTLSARFIGYSNQYLKLAQNATATFQDETGKDAFAVTRITSPAKVTSMDYVDRYWQAAEASQLAGAFDSIVDEIVIQSRYYSTLVSGDNYTQDGFVSLTDELGAYMEVKNIKGVYIGADKLISGGMFAEFAITGTVEDYDRTEYGLEDLAGFEDEILSAASQRFGIPESDAALLIQSAKNSGFIAYTSPEKFSNYVAWYADENNEYLAPYTVGGTAPSKAKYVDRSYFYMGDVTQNHVETSMLYMLVRVREDLNSGLQILDVDIPAALLPLVTYGITVDGDTLTDENVKGITCERKKPISLLYEVGLDNAITPSNITKKVKEDFRKDENGAYVFYTNRWRDDAGNAFAVPSTVDPDVFDHGIMNTTVTHFIPSLENQRFYFMENTPILDSVHDPYLGPKPSENGVYCVAYQWVEGTGNNATLKTAYNTLSAENLKDQDSIVQIPGSRGWYIKKGTPRFYFGEEVHGEQGHNHKASNPSESLGFSTYPRISYHEGHAGYYAINYHGNNGCVTVSKYGVPTTSDRTGLSAWILLLCVSGGAVCAVLYNRKRKSKAN